MKKATIKISGGLLEVLTHLSKCSGQSMEKILIQSIHLRNFIHLEQSHGNKFYHVDTEKNLSELKLN